MPKSLITTVCWCDGWTFSPYHHPDIIGRLNKPCWFKGWAALILLPQDDGTYQRIKYRTLGEYEDLDKEYLDRQATELGIGNGNITN